VARLRNPSSIQSRHLVDRVGLGFGESEISQSS
jgi:hypothetical protein